MPPRSPPHLWVCPSCGSVALVEIGTDNAQTRTAAQTPAAQIRTGLYQAQGRYGEARDFMIAFYKTWLNQTRSDPAKALRDTQLAYLKQDKLRDPRVWAPYILIE